MKTTIKKLINCIWNKLVALLRPARKAPHAAPVTTEKAKPQSDAPKMAKAAEGDWFAGRHVVLDGTNLIYMRQRSAKDQDQVKRISLTGLLAVCAGLRRRGANVKVYFDASTRYHLEDKAAEGERDLYVTLLKKRPDVFQEVPAKTMADVAVLDELAKHLDDVRPGVVISRDRYRDHEEKYPFAAKPEHRLEMRVQGNGVYFPSLRWLVPVAKAA